MENEIVRVFENKEFGKIRTAKIDDESWFVGKDVADCLAYSNSRKALADHVDDEDKGVTKRDTLGGKQEMTIINESGLYSLILGSHLPNAKQFKHWITHDVIPTIRKTGGYVNNDETFIKTYLPFADDNTKLLFKNTLETIRKQNELIENQKPMVEFANQITQSKDTIDIGQLAKVVHDENIKIGRNKLFDWLRNNKILMTNNVPYQPFIDNKYFKVIETTKHTTYGDKIFTKTLVTGKGQAYIVEKLRKEFCN